MSFQLLHSLTEELYNYEDVEGLKHIYDNFYKEDGNLIYNTTLQFKKYLLEIADDFSIPNNQFRHHWILSMLEDYDETKKWIEMVKACYVELIRTDE